MNTVQRLFSNTVLAYASNLFVKASSSLLFIFIGRALGPHDAGVFNLAITYFTITLAISGWGLHELLVRELSPRPQESKHYLINYLAIRVLLASATYGILLLFLRFTLPYGPEVKTVIRVLSLAVVPEAIFSLLQALFVAHERLLTPTLASLTNSGLKLAAGFYLLNAGAGVESIAWVMPISSALSLLVFVPGVFYLLRRVPQNLSGRLNWRFSLTQLRFTPGFILISVFSTLDFQFDAFLISLMLSESDIGWYGAAQTIVLALWMISIAIRTSLYPVMARYYHEGGFRLAVLYRRTTYYLLILALPIAAGITILAKPIVYFVYTSAFEPSIGALQWMIWSIVFAFLAVPNGRLMLIYNRQQQAGWLVGLSMATNISLNLLLIPRYGIIGAAAARTIATAITFALLYGYTQLYLLPQNILPLLWRPFLAVSLMIVAVWQLQHLSLIWSISVGGIVYIAAILIGAIPEGDRAYLQRLFTIATRR
jgi:O-antigen/teichoic acid export membrane protein